MDQHVRIAVIASVLTLAACGRKPPHAEPLRPPKPAASVAPTADFYDREGNLKGSGMRAEWLELPAGFTRSKELSVGGHEIYQADIVPLEKTCDFLSKHMLTGNVERTASSARYAGAMPVDMNSAAPRLTVQVSQFEGRIRIDVERLPLLSEVKPLSEDEARKLLSQERERMH
jgi:predicted small lipoprotein YifL